MEFRLLCSAFLLLYLMLAAGYESQAQDQPSTASAQEIPATPDRPDEPTESETPRQTDSSNGDSGGDLDQIDLSTSPANLDSNRSLGPGKAAEPEVKRVLIQNGAIEATASHALFNALHSDGSDADALDELIAAIARRIAEANREQQEAPGEPNLALGTYWLVGHSEEAFEVPIVVQDKQNIAHLITTGILQLEYLSPGWTATWDDHLPTSEASQVTDDVVASMLAQGMAGNSGGFEAFAASTLSSGGLSGNTASCEDSLRLQSEEAQYLSFAYSQPTASGKLQYLIDLDQLTLSACIQVHNRTALSWEETRVMVASPDGGVVYDLGEIALPSKQGGKFFVRDMFAHEELAAKMNGPAPSQSLEFKIQAQNIPYFDQELSSSVVQWGKLVPSQKFDWKLLNDDQPTLVFRNGTSLQRIDKLPVFAGEAGGPHLDDNERGLALEDASHWKVKVEDSSELRRITEVQANEIEYASGTTRAFAITADLEKLLPNSDLILTRHPRGKNEKLIFQLDKGAPSEQGSWNVWQVDNRGKLSFLVRTESTKTKSKLNVMTAASEDFDGLIGQTGVTTCDPSRSVEDFVANVKKHRKTIEDQTKVLMPLMELETTLATLEDGYVLDHWKHGEHLAVVRQRRSNLQQRIEQVRAEISDAQKSLELEMLKTSCFPEKTQESAKDSAEEVSAEPVP